MLIKVEIVDRSFAFASWLIVQQNEQGENDVALNGSVVEQYEQGENDAALNSYSFE